MSEHFNVSVTQVCAVLTSCARLCYLNTSTWPLKQLPSLFAVLGQALQIVRLIMSTTLVGLSMPDKS